MSIRYVIAAEAPVDTGLDVNGISGHMQHPTPPTSPRRARRVASSLLAAVAAITVVAIPTSDVEAQRVELAVNELAPEISTAATEAVAALDTFAETGDVADQRMLAWHRARTARFVAEQLGYDEFAMIDAWSRTSLTHQRAVLGALSQVGVPYRTNSSVEGEGFDCSGLTSYAWANAGIDLVRRSGDQIADAEPRSAETAMAGDLVHYPGHVMMYLGVGDAIVHSVQTGRTVEVDTLSQSRRGRVSWGDPTT